MEVGGKKKGKVWVLELLSDRSGGALDSEGSQRMQLFLDFLELVSQTGCSQ